MLTFKILFRDLEIIIIKKSKQIGSFTLMDSYVHAEKNFSFLTLNQKFGNETIRYCENMDIFFNMDEENS